MFGCIESDSAIDRFSIACLICAKTIQGSILFRALSCNALFRFNFTTGTGQAEKLIPI